MKRRNTQLVAIGVVLMLGTALLALPGSALAASQSVDPAPSATLGLPNCSYMVRSGDNLFRIAVEYFNLNVFTMFLKERCELNYSVGRWQVLAHHKPDIFGRFDEQNFHLTLHCAHI